MGVGLVATFPLTGKPHRVPEPNSNIISFSFWGVRPALPEMKAAKAAQDGPTCLSRSEDFHRHNRQGHDALKVFHDFDLAFQAAMRDLAAQRLRDARRGAANGR